MMNSWSIVSNSRHKKMIADKKRRGERKKEARKRVLTICRWARVETGLAVARGAQNRY